jgi:C4-dicarboxylate-specific signal transduction histidine kinase
LNAAIAELVALARGELDSKGVALREELAPDLAPLLARPTQIQQVMLNLMMNASEAMSAAPGNARRLAIARGMRTSTYAWRWKIRGPSRLAERGPGVRGFYTTKPHDDRGAQRAAVGRS